MELKVKIVLFVVNLLWLLVVLRMVRSRRLWERHAIFWVYMGLALLASPFLVDVFDWAALKLAIEHPPSLYLLLAILGILLLLLQLSIEMTRVVRGTRDLVQALAILESRVQDMEAARRNEAVEASGSAHGPA